MFRASVAHTYLGKLPPVQEVTGVVFEDKDKVDLVLMPYTTCESEQNDEKVDEEEAGVDLLWSALRTS